jgi:DNA-binding transcriptional ArsR family regulator
MTDDDAVFRALADASRRQLLDRLHERNGQTLGELCQGLAMTRQAVAKHLAILTEANLVSAVRQGREKLHFINPVPINDIAERWISKFERPQLAALSDLKRKLERKTPKGTRGARDRTPGALHPSTTETEEE